MNLSRWNPFRFARRGSGSGAASRSRQGTPSSRQQQQQQSDAGTGGPMGGMPQAGSRGGMLDPTRSMASVLLDPFGAFSRLDSWFGDFSDESFDPRVDVADRGDAIEVSAELPGMDRKDVQVTVEDGYLLISGEKKLERREQEQGVFHVERAFGTFQRVIPLPDGVDASRCEANFENGTLTIRLPKTAQQGGGKRVEIGSRGASQAAKATTGAAQQS
ncbi:MAG: Hsp20/alpha crystallin family protein [Acidobacteria bacterium]|nr:Hsp20/alpha crystallin family protein [Acidobacteriota bacterium]